MTLIWGAPTRTNRMTQGVTDIGATGVLQLGTAGMAAVVAAVNLNNPAGTVAGDVLTFSGFPKTAAATGAGRIRNARVRSGAGVDVMTGALTVVQKADTAWAGNTAYTAGTIRWNGPEVYKVTAPGTSAASGGPTGTGAAIADGTVTWEWMSPRVGDVSLDNIDLVAGQTVTVNGAPAPTFTHHA